MKMLSKRLTAIYSTFVTAPSSRELHSVLSGIRRFAREQYRVLTDEEKKAIAGGKNPAAIQNHN